MTLKQIVEDNFSILLRSVDPSCGLLGRLTSVPFIKDRISTIDPRLTDDHKNFALLNALREVPGDMADSVVAGFISALRSSGQDHVANIFRRESDKIIMSEEHYELLRMKRPTLCEFLNPGNCFYSPIFSEIFSPEDKRRISNKLGLSEMADEAVEILMRKSDDTFQKFITLLRETGQIQAGLNDMAEETVNIQQQPDCAFDGFVNALNKTDQSHVSYLLTGVGNPPMSDEHRKMLSAKMHHLENFVDTENGLLVQMTSHGVITDHEAERIRSLKGQNAMARSLIEIIRRKSDDAFYQFINMLHETGQSHVVYILSEEGDSRPLKEEHRRRLLSGQRDELVQKMEPQYSGLINSLMSKGVFTSYDEQRVTSVRPDTDDDRNEMILNLIARKSQQDFFNFISALNDTHQTHVVVKLIGAEIVAKVKTLYESGSDAGHMRDVDAELLEYMQEMFQRNGVVVSKLNEILAYKDLAVLSVREGCIEITFGCKSIESLHQLRNLYESGKLQNMLIEAFCSQFSEKGLESLKVVMTNDQFEECVQKFHCWIPMTPEHREALMSSEKLLINKITINDDLLRRLLLCKRRRQAIESAATGEEQVKTFIDIVSRQPDSAFTRLLDYLSDTEQTKAVDIISRVRMSEDGKLRNTFAPDASRKALSAAVDTCRFKIDTTDAWNEVDDNLECLLKSITEHEESIPPGVCSALRRTVKSIRNLREQCLVPSSRPSIEKAIDDELEQLQPVPRSPQSKPTSSHLGYYCFLSNIA